MPFVEDLEEVHNVHGDLLEEEWLILIHISLADARLHIIVVLLEDNVLVELFCFQNVVENLLNQITEILGTV
jgi:hypothetical protein